MGFSSHTVYSAVAHLFSFWGRQSKDFFTSQNCLKAWSSWLVCTKSAHLMLVVVSQFCLIELKGTSFSTSLLFSIWKRLPYFFTNFLLNIIAVRHLFQVLCYMGLFHTAPGRKIFVDDVALLSLDPLEISLAVGPSNDVAFHFGDFHTNVLLFVVAVFL